MVQLAWNEGVRNNVNAALFKRDNYGNIGREIVPEHTKEKFVVPIEFMFVK